MKLEEDTKVNPVVLVATFELGGAAEQHCFWKITLNITETLAHYVS